MKHFLISILGCLSLLGCHSKNEKNQLGALSQIKDFEVCVFFSPYEKFDRDLLFNTLVDALKTIGPVEMIDSPLPSAVHKTSGLFLLSLGGYQQENIGSIEIISPVKLEASQFEMYCSIWKINFDLEAENYPYPVIEDNKVSFKTPSSAFEHKIKSEDTPLAVLKQMITYFAKEYHQFNPENERPTFHVHIKRLLTDN